MGHASNMDNVVWSRLVNSTERGFHQIDSATEVPDGSSQDLPTIDES